MYGITPDVLYPGAGFTTRDYHVERLAASSVLDEAMLDLGRSGSLWQLQQIIADARFQMIQKMIESDMAQIPSRDHVRIAVQVQRECLPAYLGITDIPPLSHTVTAYEYGGRR